MVILFAFVLVVFIYLMKIGYAFGLTDGQTYLLIILAYLLFYFANTNKKKNKKKTKKKDGEGILSILWWDFVNIINLPLMLIILLCILIAGIS